MLPLRTQHIPTGFLSWAFTAQTRVLWALKNPFITEIVKPVERKEAGVRRSRFRAPSGCAGRAPGAGGAAEPLAPRRGSVTLGVSFRFAGLSFPLWDEV